MGNLFKRPEEIPMNPPFVKGDFFAGLSFSFSAVAQRLAGGYNC